MDKYKIEVEEGGMVTFTLNGFSHRDGGPAITYKMLNDKSKGRCSEWYHFGKLHREGGPAIEYSHGSKSWWLNGKRHREDGPAIEWLDCEEWWIHGRQIDHKGFLSEVKTDRWGDLWQKHLSGLKSIRWLHMVQGFITLIATNVEKFVRF